MTKTRRARCMLEFKQEAVRLVEGGQSIAAAARTLGLVEQTLFNWVQAQRVGKLIRAKGKRRFKVATDSHHSLPVVANLQDRQFTVHEPDKVWVGGCSGTTETDCTRRWPASARCSSKKTGWPVKPGKPAHESTMGYGFQGQGQNLHFSR